VRLLQLSHLRVFFSARNSFTHIDLPLNTSDSL
jgi:hypothetical protein